MFKIIIVADNIIYIKRNRLIYLRLHILVKMEPEYPQRTTNMGKQFVHLQLLVECTFFVIYKAGCEPTFWKLISQKYIVTTTLQLLVCRVYNMIYLPG
jgi:hypothetical protein